MTLYSKARGRHANLRPPSKCIKKKMKSIRPLLFVGVVTILGACAMQPQVKEQTSQSIRWVRDSAEYVAVSRQAYRAAQIAMPAMVADKSWSALPDQQGAADLPPAVILDVDQTALTNPHFQAQLEPPFSESKLNEWSVTHKGTPVPGVVAFANEAEIHGVALFFMTNRACEPKPESNDSCPQKQVVMQDLIEAGLPATAENVSLAGERPGWGKEKKTRRDWIAENYRVIQLIGDDLSDFIPCVRRRPVAPCTVGGTIDNRFGAAAEYDAYWGAGWYILPNPMHGSWTSVR
jgi:acid phosphatase